MSVNPLYTRMSHTISFVGVVFIYLAEWVRRSRAAKGAQQDFGHLKHLNISVNIQVTAMCS